MVTSMGVALFVSPIFWYLSFNVSAFNPCETQKCCQIQSYNFSVQNLPRKVPPEKIHEHVTQCLKVVSPALLFPCGALCKPIPKIENDLYPGEC